MNIFKKAFLRGCMYIALGIAPAFTIWVAHGLAGSGLEFFILANIALLMWVILCRRYDRAFFTC